MHIKKWAVPPPPPPPPPPLPPFPFLLLPQPQAYISFLSFLVVLFLSDGRCLNYVRST